MPKACIYAGFRHLFYKMALLGSICGESNVMHNGTCSSNGNKKEIVHFVSGVRVGVIKTNGRIGTIFHIQKLIQ